MKCKYFEMCLLLTAFDLFAAFAVDFVVSTLYFIRVIYKLFAFRTGAEKY